MLRSRLLAVLPVLLLAALPMAARADDLADFAEYVETCVADVGTIDKLVIACVDDQVAAQESYLGDILIETEGVIAEAQVPALRATQAAWESYRDKSCAYHAALKPRDAAPRALMCRLRLVNARIAEVLAGDEFAAFED